MLRQRAFENIAIKSSDKRLVNAANMLTKCVFVLCDDLPPFPALDHQWRILLELYKSRSVSAYMNVSSIALASEIPETTSLRIQKSLQDNRLIDRRPDPEDKRRVWVSLTQKGVNAVEEALERFADSVEGTAP